MQALNTPHLMQFHQQYWPHDELKVSVAFYSASFSNDYEKVVRQDASCHLAV